MSTPPQSVVEQRVINTAQLISTMLKAKAHVSELIFSPGRAPQIESNGQLVELKFKGLECLSAQDTWQIAQDLMGKNDHPVKKLETEGKSLLDAMGDGDTEGMQQFDAEIEKLTRAGVVDFETGLSYSTNAGNLRLELADFTENPPRNRTRVNTNIGMEVEIER